MNDTKYQEIQACNFGGVSTNTLLKKMASPHSIIRDITLKKVMFKETTFDLDSNESKVEAKLERPIAAICFYLPVSLEHYYFQDSKALSIFDQLHDWLPPESCVIVDVFDIPQVFNCYLIYLAIHNSSDKVLPKQKVWSHEMIDLILNCDINASDSPETEEDFFSNAIKFLPLAKKMGDRWLNAESTKLGLYRLGEKNISVITNRLSSQLPWQSRDEKVESEMSSPWTLYAEKFEEFKRRVPGAINGKYDRIKIDNCFKFVGIFGNCIKNYFDWVKYGTNFFKGTETLVFDQRFRDASERQQSNLPNIHKTPVPDFTGGPASDDIFWYAVILSRIMQHHKLNTRYLKIQLTKQEYKIDEKKLTKVLPVKTRTQSQSPSKVIPADSPLLSDKSSFSDSLWLDNHRTGFVEQVIRTNDSALMRRGGKALMQIGEGMLLSVMADMQDRVTDEGKSKRTNVRSINK